jgi:gamma-glutamylcyclotransferase (GGCT)/AIG2-like uncharacterized protein YtfP
MKTAKELLFVYGTLLEPAIQKNVIGRLVPAEEDGIEGYIKTTIELSCGNFPAIMKKDGGVVTGRILELTQAELELCDLYEGEDYKREKIITHRGIEVWVYKPVIEPENHSV